ncbi:DUF6636 domain-containing protein [uncultured Kingella sp.]|uniref:DUF6636 domain-containing protein n=1 Tax=uncultured Kingella sp. TaxID=159270 RepID=UPI002598104F|nr:DUF6636 domain-containing protein [uncultured Kingella sp.]
MKPSQGSLRSEAAKPKPQNPSQLKGTPMKPTAALTALLLSSAPAHALIVHPDIWFGSDNGNIRCGGYPQYISGVVCEIHRSENNIQPHTARPEACGNGDWHYRFAIDDQGEARAFCVNDRLRHLGAASLANGETWRRKNWRCTQPAARHHLPKRRRTRLHAHPPKATDFLGAVNQCLRRLLRHKMADAVSGRKSRQNIGCQQPPKPRQPENPLRPHFQAASARFPLK